MHLALQPAGTLGVLERYTRSNTIPIARSLGDGVACAIVAEVNGGGGVTGETDGDKLAALFAAAPELLAALEEIAARGPVIGYNTIAALTLRITAMQSIARAAIAKATATPAA